MEVERCARAVVAGALALIAGCSDDAEPLRDASTECPAGASSSTPGLPRDAQLACLNAELLAAIAASPCPGAGCALVDVVPTPAVAAPSSEGARILLLDEAIATVAATRYQSRTLAYLARASDGTYQAVAPTRRLPKDAAAIFATVDRFPGPLASEELHVVTPFAQKFASALPGWTGHGMDILPFLADRIPAAQLVVSEDLLDAALRDPQLCAANAPATREAALQTLEAQLARTEQSLIAAIQQYAINYLHLSWGLTRPELAQLLASQCGASPPVDVLDRILGDYVVLLSALASQTTQVGGDPRPVVLFQAGTGADHVLHEGDADYLTDCTTFPGRVRVFAAAYTGTDIPLEGSSDPKFVTPFAQRTLACLDVLVNVGYTGPFDVRPAPQFFPTSSLGLGVGARPSWPAVSSFANPVALAYFAYLAQQHPGDSVAQRIARLTRDDTKPAVDPLLYGMFPRPSQFAP